MYCAFDPNPIDTIILDNNLSRASLLRSLVGAHRKVRHNAGPIAVQPKSKSRRTYQLRGSGPSQQGRPTQEEARRQQLNILEDSEVVYTSLPTKKQKTAHPHNLELSVSQDRRPERKH